MPVKLTGKETEQIPHEERRQDKQSVVFEKSDSEFKKDAIFSSRKGWRGVLLGKLIKEEIFPT